MLLLSSVSPEITSTLTFILSVRCFSRFSQNHRPADDTQIAHLNTHALRKQLFSFKNKVHRSDYHNSCISSSPSYHAAKLSTPFISFLLAYSLLTSFAPLMPALPFWAPFEIHKKLRLIHPKGNPCRITCNLLCNHFSLAKNYLPIFQLPSRSKILGRYFNVWLTADSGNLEAKGQHGFVKSKFSP